MFKGRKRGHRREFYLPSAESEMDEKLMDYLRTEVPSQNTMKSRSFTFKGILLYGDPGVDKESIARLIVQMTKIDKFKFVDCSNILSIFDGDGQVKSDHPLEEAEKDKNGFYVVIFNKLDYLFQCHDGYLQLGGFGNAFVDYMRSKLEGSNRLGNIQIIGITARKNLIHPGLLNEWCFANSVEVPLPNSRERKRLLGITMRKIGVSVASDISVTELAELTNNYSGAEIAAAVHAASKNALVRYGDKHKTGLEIHRMDFIDAIGEVQPDFGTNEQALQRLTSDMSLFSSAATKLLRRCEIVVGEVRSSMWKHTGTRGYFTVKSVLLYGPPGSGKCAIAASVALASEFRCIKLLAAANMKNMTEKQKIAHIEWVFSHASIFNPSIIVIDHIEKIIECRENGYLYNTKLLELLQTKMFSKLEPQRPLLVLVTSTRDDVLKRLGMASCFTHSFFVESVTSINGLKHIMESRHFLEPEKRAKALTEIQKKIGLLEINVGISHILRIVNAARLTDDPGAEFIEAIVDAIKTNLHQ